MFKTGKQFYDALLGKEDWGCYAKFEDHKVEVNKIQVSMNFFKFEYYKNMDFFEDLQSVCILQRVSQQEDFKFTESGAIKVISEHFSDYFRIGSSGSKKKCCVKYYDKRLIMKSNFGNTCEISISEKNIPQQKEVIESIIDFSSHAGRNL